MDLSSLYPAPLLDVGTTDPCDLEKKKEVKIMDGWINISNIKQLSHMVVLFQTLNSVSSWKWTEVLKQTPFLSIRSKCKIGLKIKNIKITNMKSQNTFE